MRPWHCCFCERPIAAVGDMWMRGPGTDSWYIMAANHRHDPGSFQVAHDECLWREWEAGRTDRSYWYEALGISGAPEVPA